MLETIDVNCPEGGRHEFEMRVFQSDDGEQVFGVIMCSKCDYDLSEDEELRFINAAMQLTADEAESRVDYNIMGVHTEDERMKEYARRWRGDTEESE